MRTLFARIDALLRSCFAGQSAPAAEPAGFGATLAPVLLLGAVCGLGTGLYGAVRPSHPALAQWAATTAKVPLLFLASLVVTLPSLYVFAALNGAQVRLGRLAVIALEATIVMTAVLASLAPVVAFFTLSSNDYRFLVLLNVALFAVSGLIGVKVLRRRIAELIGIELRRRPPPPSPSASPPAPEPKRRAEGPGMEPTPATVSGAAPTKAAEETPRGAETLPGTAPGAGRGVPLVPVMRYGPDAPAEGLDDGFPIVADRAAAPLPPLPPRRRPDAEEAAHTVLRVWTILFALVGAQMSWILRPFIGSPDGPFTLFRERRSHFFAAVWRTFELLLFR
jgi:hypothetical protein